MLSLSNTLIVWGTFIAVSAALSVTVSLVADRVMPPSLALLTAASVLLVGLVVSTKVLF